jgi:predicted DNA-binding transcriptional regulator YafY
VRDDQGREYTTFRPTIGREALSFEGRRAHIEFHEQERNGFQNVYLDGISALPEKDTEGATDTDPDEAAWRTAVEAAPWVLGSSEPDHEMEPEELYEKLEPFKRLVAEDIRGEDDADDE